MLTYLLKTVSVGNSVREANSVDQDQLLVLSILILINRVGMGRALSIRAEHKDLKGDPSDLRTNILQKY